jgi:hypothetical protein
MLSDFEVHFVLFVFTRHVECAMTQKLPEQGVIHVLCEEVARAIGISLDCDSVDAVEAGSLFSYHYSTSLFLKADVTFEPFLQLGELVQDQETFYFLSRLAGVVQIGAPVLSRA